MSAPLNAAERLIRKPEVVERVGLSASQIDRLEREGRFPRRVPLGMNSVAWVESEVLAWVRERIERRDGGTDQPRRMPVPPRRSRRASQAPESVGGAR
jgi:prophage regulatory protein